MSLGRTGNDFRKWLGRAVCFCVLALNFACSRENDSSRKAPAAASPDPQGAPPGFTLSPSGQTAAQILERDNLLANTMQKVRIQITSQVGEPIPDLKLISVKPWMSVHGHGSTKPVWRAANGQADDFLSVGGVRAGRDWIVEKLFFVMSGPWELEVTIEAPHLASETIVIPLEVK